MWETIIGVCGTLAGTCLGWGLSKIKTGKLKININHFGNEQFNRYVHNPLLQKDDKQENEVDSYSFDFVISLYNESEKVKTIRDLQISFRDSNNNELFAKPIEDLETARFNGSVYKIDFVGVINLTGLIGLDIKARVSVKDNNINNLYNTNKIYLCYKDEKFESKEYLINDNFKPSEEQFEKGEE